MWIDQETWKMRNSNRGGPSKYFARAALQPRALEFKRPNIGGGGA